MIKKLLISSLFLILSVVQAQDTDRITIEGAIAVPPGDDPEGISIYNKTSQQGTISGDLGKFDIAVALDDTLIFRALQFQEFTVVINQRVLETRTLNVFVQEAVTELEEVVVSPIDLTGNVTVDVSRIEVVTPDFPYMTAAEAMFEYRIRPDSLTTPENAAFQSSQTRLVHGLDLAKIFKAMVRADQDNEEKRPNADIDENMRKIYEDEFFREHLDIEKKNINDFIYYASDNGLTEEMLQEGNELELIKFLVEQSKAYKKMRSEN